MVHYHVPNEKRTKLKAKARWGVHLGMSQQSKGWKILDILTNKIVTSRDVTFYEKLSRKAWLQMKGEQQGDANNRPFEVIDESALPDKDFAEVSNQADAQR
jgi:hypothetical protein